MCAPQCTRKQNTGSWRKACWWYICELLVRCCIKWNVLKHIVALYALNLNIPSWFSTWIYNVNLINIQTYVVLFCVKFSSIRVPTYITRLCKCRNTACRRNTHALSRLRIRDGTVGWHDSEKQKKKGEVITVTIELNNSCIWRLWLDMYLRKNISVCMRSGVVQ